MHHPNCVALAIIDLNRTASVSRYAFCPFRGNEMAGCTRTVIRMRAFLSRSRYAWPAIAFNLALLTENDGASLVLVSSGSFEMKDFQWRLADEIK